MDDWKLLQEYVERGSEAAFQGLVSRHVDMVHAAAVRQLRDSHLAQDVTQAVFILLARKAASLSSSVILSGWLYRTTAHVASRALRDRIRQQRREQEATMMITTEPADELWEKLAPHLDAAIGGLGSTDRDAVVLRFLQQRSFREVGDSLGVSEDAAKKRVTRALEKLRSHLTSRGIAVTGVALAGVFGSHACVAAPISVVAVVNAAVVGTASVGASSLVGVIAREWLMTKVKLAAGMIVGAAAVLFITAQVVLVRPAPPTPSSPPSVVAIAADEKPPIVEADVPRENLPAVTNTRTMRLKVLSTVDRSPLAAARAQFTFYGAKYVGGKAMADANGVMEITRPDRKYSGMAYWVSAPGHIPKCISWKREEAFSLPAEYEVALEPGLSASGRVVDESGQPVAGATLEFESEGMKWNSREYVDYRYPAIVPTSDERGEWSADFLDARPLISGCVKHRDFAETEFRFAFAGGGASNISIILSNGAAITGVVLGANQQPIAGATVRGDWQHSTRDEIKTKTDYLGQFQFPHVTPGLLQIKISANGYHAIEKWHDLTTAGLALTNTLDAVKLAGSATVRGQVVDETGTPVGNAWVNLAQGQPELDGVNWSGTTDDAGRFVWSNAPDGGARFNVGAWEFQSVSDIQLASGETEHTIYLRGGKTSKLLCRVTDKISGQPVPRFRVMHGELDLTWREEVDGLVSMNFAGEGVNGSFTFPWVRRKSSRESLIVDVVRVEAEGYEPGIARITNSVNPVTEVAVQLDPAGQLTGVVWTPSGAVAKGAQVALVGGILRVEMQSPAQFLPYGPDPRQHRTKTLDDGSFQISTRREANQVLVVHDQGIAVLSVESFSGGNIVLQPWGKIEGRIKVGDQPGARLDLMVRNVASKPDGLEFYFQAKADAEGRFSFEKVPPGNVEVGRWMLTPFSRDGTGHTTTTQLQPVKVVAGKTAQVTIGGNGIQVRGRLALSRAIPEAVLELAAQNLRPTSIEADPTKPPSGYGFFCRPDGAFVIEDVSPGSYMLELQIYAVRDRNKPDDSWGFPVGKHTLEVTVPENQTGPFDLGEISVPATK